MDGKLGGSLFRQWYLVAVLSTGVLLSFTDRLIINLVVDRIRADLSLSDLQLSLLQGFGFAIIFAVAGLPMGRVADQANRRNLIVAGIVIWSAATAACGLAQSFAQLFVLRMIVGLGEAVLMPAAASMITDAFPFETRGRALSSFGIGAVLGSGVALSLGALLLVSIQTGLLSDVSWLREVAPWRGVFIVAGLPGIVLVPLMFTLNEPTRRDRVGLQPLSEVLARLTTDRGRVVRTCLSIGVVASGDYGLLSWLPTLLERSHGMSSIAIGGIVGGVVAVGGLFACVAAGFLSDRVAVRHGAPARRRVMFCCYVVCAAGAVFLFLPGQPALLVGFVLWIVGSVAGSVVGIAVLQEGVPNEMRATTMALAGLCSAVIGLGMGPTLVALVARSLPAQDGQPLHLAIASVCAAGALSGLALLHRSPRSDGQIGKESRDHLDGEVLESPHRPRDLLGAHMDDR